MFNEFKEFWFNSFNFKGRARRREYWVANLYCSSVYLILASILFLTVLFGTMVEDDSTGIARVFLGVFCLILVLVLSVYFIMGTIAQVSLCVRRCHDLGYSGYIYLLCVLGSFCCGIGGIVWIVLCCMDSKREDNKWGNDPKNTFYNKYINSTNNSIIASVTIYIVTLVIYLCIYSIYSVSFSSSLIDDLNTRIEQEYLEDADNFKQNNPTDFSGSSWKSFKVSIDGSIITLPCSFSELENMGYHIKDSYVDTTNYIEPNHYTTGIKLENEEGKVLFARFINYSEEDKFLDECDIYSVSVDAFYETPDVELCGGLNMGMSLKEVLGIYGKPDYNYESDDGSYMSIAYYAEPDKSYNGNLDIDFSEGKIITITLESKKH